MIAGIFSFLIGLVIAFVLVGVIVGVVGSGRLRAAHKRRKDFEGR